MAKAKTGVPIAVVELLKPSGEFHRFNARSLRVPAGMVRDAFRRVGADEWDAVSERFRAAEPPVKRVEAAE